MSEFKTKCPLGHEVSFSDPGLEEVSEQRLTLRVQEPEIYKANYQHAIAAVDVHCDTCNQDYPLSDCKA